jgi:hypothetical protein
LWFTADSSDRWPPLGVFHVSCFIR